MCAVAFHRPSGRRAEYVAQPGFIPFCDPTLRDTPPTEREWLHEIKIDGYRAQLHIARGRITVYSRSGYDWTDQFRAIADAARSLASHDLIIDGEAMVSGATGLPD